MAVVSKYFGYDLVFILALTKVSSERSSIWSTFVMFDELLVLLGSIAICANNATIMWVDPFCYHRAVWRAESRSASAVRGLSKNRYTPARSSQLLNTESESSAEKCCLGSPQIPVGKNYRKSEHCCDNWYLTGSVVRDNTKDYWNKVNS